MAGARTVVQVPEPIRLTTVPLFNLPSCSCRRTRCTAARCTVFHPQWGVHPLLTVLQVLSHPGAWGRATCATTNVSRELGNYSPRIIHHPPDIDLRSVSGPSRRLTLVDSALWAGPRRCLPLTNSGVRPPLPFVAVPTLAGGWVLPDPGSGAWRRLLHDGRDGCRPSGRQSPRLPWKTLTGG